MGRSLQYIIQRTSTTACPESAVPLPSLVWGLVFLDVVKGEYGCQHWGLRRRRGGTQDQDLSGWGANPLPGPKHLNRGDCTAILSVRKMRWSYETWSDKVRGIRPQYKSFRVAPAPARQFRERNRRIHRVDASW